MLCPRGRTSRMYIYGGMRDRSMQSGTELAREIQPTDWSTPGNLSNRSSGVQIPRDICIRFGRYLYSTKCSWIIIDSYYRQITTDRQFVAGPILTFPTAVWTRANKVFCDWLIRVPIFPATFGRANCLIISKPAQLQKGAFSMGYVGKLLVIGQLKDQLHHSDLS